MPADKQDYVRAELDFFEAVTSVSGKLYAVPKDERKAAAVSIVKQVRQASSCASSDPITGCVLQGCSAGRQ